MDIRTRSERPRPLRVMLTPAEKELLAHLIYAEAGTEPYEGQVAVAAVVLNRLASPHFPGTVEGIVFQPRAFQPVATGSFGGARRTQPAGHWKTPFGAGIRRTAPSISTTLASSARRTGSAPAKSCGSSGTITLLSDLRDKERLLKNATRRADT